MTMTAMVFSGWGMSETMRCRVCSPKQHVGGTPTLQGLPVVNTVIGFVKKGEATTAILAAVARAAAS